MGAVLIVEDDPDLREDLGVLIEHQGYEVVTAANGQEALAMLRTRPLPCVVILDLMMPIMDGWTLRAEMLDDPELSAVPVILVSGVADLEGAAASLEAVAHLVKPLDLDRLYRLIADSCAKAAQAPPTT